MQRIRDLKPYRLGILSPENSSQRAPAMAWSEYCIEPSMKGNVQFRRDKENQFVWFNMDQYPGIDGEVHTKNASPAAVQVVDRDLGILHIAYRLDPYGLRASIHPSRTMVAGKMAPPSRNLALSKIFGFSQDTQVSGSPGPL